MITCDTDLGPSWQHIDHIADLRVRGTWPMEMGTSAVSRGFVIPGLGKSSLGRHGIAEPIAVVCSDIGATQPLAAGAPGLLRPLSSKGR